LENDDPISLWLAARWMGDEPAGRRARVALQDYDGEELAILANSLRGDLEAMDLVAAGDSSAALATWRNATNRHQVETVFFGLVGSLWPLQLERARVAFAMGLHDEVLEATAQFEQTVGFMDQAAWLDGLRLRANAFRARDNTEIPDARRARSCLAYVLGNANGAGVAEYEAVTAEWGVDGSPTCVLP